MTDKNSPKHTSIVIDNRKRLVINGVINIEGFDDGEVTLIINEGKINVEGSELKIESLTKESGEIIITGDINGVFYSRQKLSSGLLSKIFG